MQEEIYSFLLHVGILKDGRRKSWKEKKARCGDVQDKSNILERQTSSGNRYLITSVMELIAQKESLYTAEKLGRECKIKAPGLKRKEGFRQTRRTFCCVSKEGIKGGG